MNIDCRVLLSQKGIVDHVPKLQAQHTLCKSGVINIDLWADSY